MMQIRCLQELKRLQPVKRGFQVVIAERCHISAPGINKCLKKVMEQGLITKYYTFTEYGEQWISVYGHLVERLERYLEEIQIPESEKEKHIRMMVEDMDPFLLESMLSYYCACEICCNVETGITATGTPVVEGRTIAVDPNVIPYGTEVIINGHVFTVEDCRGGVNGNHIDIYVSDHQRALDLGVGQAEVYLTK